MLYMITRVLIEHKDFTKINYKEFANERFQHLIHEAHKGARGVAKPKGHHLPFIKALMSFECSLLLITKVNLNLVIYTSQIKF